MDVQIHEFARPSRTVLFPVWQGNKQCPRSDTIVFPCFHLHGHFDLRTGECVQHCNERTRF